MSRPDLTARAWLAEYEGRNGGDARQAARLVAATVAGSLVLVLGGWGIGTATAEEAPACGTVTIQPGDTLAALGRQHGHTVEELAAWNGIADPNLIIAGRDLCVDPPLIQVAAVTARQRADHCTGGPRPGAIALQSAVLDNWPGLTSLGLYNCRESRGGSAHSTHAEGRAIDYGVPSCDSDQGQAIARHLVDRAELLGLQRVLVCELEWVVGEGWSTPSDQLQALHDGRSAPAHIHAELSRQAAEVLTTEYVTQILTNDQTGATS